MLDIPKDLPHIQQPDDEHVFKQYEFDGIRIEFSCASHEISANTEFIASGILGGFGKMNAIVNSIARIISYFYRRE